MASGEKKQSRLVMYAGRAFTVPVEWWNDFTMLDDTDEKRFARETEFERLATILLSQGQKAIGVERAATIWRRISTRPARKIKGQPHKPDEDAVLLKLYDEHAASSVQGAKARATREFIKFKQNNVTSDAVNRHLSRLLKARAVAAQEAHSKALDAEKKMAHLPRTLLNPRTKFE